MKKDLTEIVFILDRSGSMAGLEADTIGGFNAMIEEQKRQTGEAYVTTIVFDNVSQTIHDRLPLEKVPRLTGADYSVRGCTALMDAIGGAIRHIVSIHRYARPEDVPEKTLFVITTDGMENASRHFDSDTVKRMIEHEKQKYGWEFLFIGANIDAVHTAARFGIDEAQAVNYNADAKGTHILFESVSAAVGAVRSMPKAAPMSRRWREKLDKDFETRK